MPVVALVNLRSAEDGVRRADAFRKGLDEAGYVEGQNVTVSTTGWTVDLTGCRQLWRTSCAVGWL